MHCFKLNLSIASASIIFVFFLFFLLPHKTTQQAVADSVSMTNFSLIQIQFDQSAVELISYQFNDEDRFSFFSLIVINCSILFILHRFQIWEEQTSIFTMFLPIIFLGKTFLWAKICRYFSSFLFLVIGFSFVNSQSAYTTAESNFTTVITTQNTSESQTTAAFTTGQTTTQSPTTDTTSSSPNSTTTTTTKVSPITQSPSKTLRWYSLNSNENELI